MQLLQHHPAPRFNTARLNKIAADLVAGRYWIEDNGTVHHINRPPRGVPIREIVIGSAHTVELFGKPRIV